MDSRPACAGCRSRPWRFDGALEGGGIGIHLSDNCELTLAPLPMAGCAFGKRKARGDLFDELKAPVAPGDWKDR